MNLALYNQKMNRDEINKMFEGIDDNRLELIVREPKAILVKTLSAINKRIADGVSIDDIIPRPELIMNAFRLCGDIKVVLLGQDPYIKQHEAMGLSFSVPVGVKIPPSLKMIYECLLYSGLINKKPQHGDLTDWARQGVLLLNAALTTEKGRSNVHALFWRDYTDWIIKKLSSDYPKLIFILLGKFAQEKKSLIDNRHDIFEWGHPSSLNAANRTDNPKNFKYCNVFRLTNQSLIDRGLDPIDWNIKDVEIPALPIEHQFELRDKTDQYPTPPDTGIWAFTDGGAIKNGKPNCKASWGFCITDGKQFGFSYGGVTSGETTPTNNRGELTALLNVLNVIKNHCEHMTNPITIVSDSRYGINCISEWGNKWQENPDDLVGKKNLDLIIPAVNLLNEIKKRQKCELIHVRSHLKEPAKNTKEWFIWYNNSMVDDFCNINLGNQPSRHYEWLK